MSEVRSKRMWFRAQQVDQGSISLTPFVLRMREGYLLGMGADPTKGGPCAHCCELWLTRRRVVAEQIQTESLPIRRDLLDALIAENSPHVFYELASDGTSTRMDCLVFPHPQCPCSKKTFVAPVKTPKRTNFAFSPVHQIKCARFGTPNGNVWLTSVKGQAPLSDRTFQVLAAGRDREVARFHAVDEWLKRASLSDLLLSPDLAPGHGLPVRDFRTGAQEVMPRSALMDLTHEAMGAGANLEDATMNAFLALAKARTIRKYTGAMKNPMLIVGTNNWVRGRVPFFLLQQYDLHLLFYPNSTPSWVVGVAAMSRLRTDEPPVFVFGADTDILKALDSALLKMLEHCPPADWAPEEQSELSRDDEKSVRSNRVSKLGLWWTHWIYRCPKISLKDVLHLEAYKASVEGWKDYFTDGQEKLSILSLNQPIYPGNMRSLVKIHSLEQAASPSRNINGIGTWASFRDAAV